MPSINVRGCVYALCALLMFSPVALTGQSRHFSRDPISAELSTDEVVTELRHMQVDEISEELMISYIRSRGHAYQLTAEQVIRLKDGGVDDIVVKALMAIALLVLHPSRRERKSPLYQQVSQSDPPKQPLSQSPVCRTRLASTQNNAESGSKYFQRS
jgi:hypothetical protein